MKFIATNAISINSTDEYYIKESSLEFGKGKPNTIRILSKSEMYELMELYSYHKNNFFIDVNKEGSEEFFRRLVTDITCFGEVAGRYYVIISWEKVIA